MTLRAHHLQRQPKIALLTEAPNAYARGLLLGIGEYILAHGPWSVYLAEYGPNDPPPAWLTSWDGDGVIARGENPKIARFLQSLPIPMVDMTPSRLIPRAPWVKSDDAAIATLAAQHLLERGFQKFAFCGNSNYLWSNARLKTFASLVRREGLECFIHQPKHRLNNGDAEVDAIVNWLKPLPKPLGIFASYDKLGQQVLNACRRASIAVPEDVAVLGVDNDEVLCALSSPALSSVILNPHRTGWEAAALLDGMMKGEDIPVQSHLVAPVGVATRQSSDILAVADPQIGRALRYIREHAHKGIRVNDILPHCAMSRRAMELRFQELLGRSPHQEITRVQINQVKRLLSGTTLNLADIAVRTGYAHQEYLSVVFKRETKMTASQFREQHSGPRIYKPAW